MGFFSDLKHDLSQAVNELMPEEDLKAIPPVKKDNTIKEVPKAESIKENTHKSVQPKEETFKENIMKESTFKKNTCKESRSLEEMLETIDSIQLPEELARELAKEEEPIVFKKPKAAGMVHDSKQAAKDMGEADLEKIQAHVVTAKASDEVAVIASGMTIAGDITFDGSLDIKGSVNGNVAIWGSLYITGKLTGDCKAAGVYAKGAKVNGLIISDGPFEIDAATVVIGDISATSAVIAGAVKGDIDIKGPVILEASAIVMGNIKSKSVQINNGAVIEGMCSQCYADVIPTAFFDEFKPDMNKLRT
ncbi:MAG: polymer-forming cytoskeletal protein [Lachnospiraceae bacterium]|nr:polymer-forming cytoskeletal protein [Lachnospiraceae bacterium]